MIFKDKNGTAQKTVPFVFMLEFAYLFQLPNRNSDMQRNTILYRKIITN